MRLLSRGFPVAVAACEGRLSFSEHGGLVVVQSLPSL